VGCGEHLLQLLNRDRGGRKIPSIGIIGLVVISSGRARSQTWRVQLHFQVVILVKTVCMGRIERQRVEGVGLLDTGIDLENQVRVRALKPVRAIVIDIRRRVVTRFQHAATGFDGKHFSD
jgi:hypothetical protein